MGSPRAILVTAAALALTVLACGERRQGATGAPAVRELRVAAAASLKGALEDLAASFGASHAGVRVVPTYGASGNLFAQLSSKAPFDLFMSADTTYPRKLVEAGQASGAERLYAVGVLALWIPSGSSLKPEILGLASLTDPSVKHVAIANPQHAPYGRAAEAAMKAAGVYGDLRDKLVLGENAEQTAQFVQSGAADAALLPLSLAILPAMTGAGRYTEIDPSLYPPIEHALVVTAWAQAPSDAAAFCDHVLSAAGRETLSRHGFKPPIPPPGN